MNSMNKSLATVGMAVGLALGATSASAAVINAWQLNLDLLNGVVLSDNSVISGATDAVNIDHIVVNGKAVVEQTVVNGTALGQPFVDTGYLQLLSNSKESGGAVANLDFGTADGDQVFGYFTYDSLTGTLNNDGTITFDPLSGTVKLWVENDGDLIPTTGGVLEIAEFNIIAPSGGSNLDFFGGTASNSTVDITLDVASVTTGFASFFLDSSGDENNPITQVAFHLINVDSLLDPNFNPNPDNTGVDEDGNGVSIIRVQNAGQYNLTQKVPEPSMLGVFGLGLVAMGFAGRRRSSKG